jgi:hypothetical protein
MTPERRRRKMILRSVAKVMIFVTVIFGLSQAAAAQGAPGGGAAGGAASIPTSTGTFSIESEILAYQALRANSTEIAREATALRGTYKDANNQDRGQNVILVPSSSTAVPAFQLWRSHMLIVHNFLRQSQILLQGTDGCPTTHPADGPPPSFAGYTTAIGGGVTAIQGILSLFSNSQSMNEFTGTIQDQALILAVARELRKRGVMVLTPDIYGPSTIATIDPGTFPFISILNALIDQHGTLQAAYVCNAVAATAAGQIQQAEIARETDYAKLAKLGASDAVKVQPLLDDIAAQTGILALLRLKIGLSAGYLNTINNTNEADIVTQGQVVGNQKATAADRNNALGQIHNDDVSTSNLEMPAITQINLKVAKIISLVTGIESYLSGLTGGSITLTPPTAPSSSTTSATSTPAQGAAQPGGAQPTTGGTGNGNGTTPGTTTAPSSPTSSSSAPTIVTILQADGLAARMGFTVTADFSTSSTQLNQWIIVWLKALESGGSIINEATILGSHPYFGGGAVSGYALYQLNGDLICSANVASYGGYVKAKDFPGFAATDHTVRAIEIGGNCMNGQP